MKSVRGLPELRVEVDGTPMAPEELRALESVRVQQHLSLPALCELTFTDPRGALATRGLPPGSALRIAVAARREPLFVGEVTAVEYEWGCNAKPEDITKALDADPSIKAVLCQHSETSTGIVNDVQALGPS